MPEQTLNMRVRTLYAPVAWFASENPTLKEGEFGTEKETGRTKIGDGVTAWSSLAYLSGAREKPARFAVTTPDAAVKFGYVAEVGGTISSVTSAVLGTDTPECLFSLRHGADMSQVGTEVVTGGITCDGPNVVTTTFDSPVMTAGEWLWFTVLAVSGTVDSISVTVQF